MMDPWASVPIPPKLTALITGVPLVIIWVAEAAFVAMFLIGGEQPVALGFLTFWTLIVGLAMFLLWRDFMEAMRQLRTQRRREGRR